MMKRRTVCFLVSWTDRGDRKDVLLSTRSSSRGLAREVLAVTSSSRDNSRDVDIASASGGSPEFSPGHAWQDYTKAN